MKPIRIEEENLKKAVNNGPTYIQVGDKIFMLIEIEEVDKNGSYVVTDPVEESKLFEAMNEYNPILSEKEINERLNR